MCEGSTGSAAIGEAQRVVRGRGPPQNHGMGRQGTWEILLLPVGKDAGKGIASMKIQTPVRRRACTATGAPQGGHEPWQAPAEPAGENNKPKDMRGLEVVAPS